MATVEETRPDVIAEARQLVGVDADDVYVVDRPSALLEHVALAAQSLAVDDRRMGNARTIEPLEDVSRGLSDPRLGTEVAGDVDAAGNRVGRFGADPADFWDQLDGDALLLAARRPEPFQERVSMEPARVRERLLQLGSAGMKVCEVAREPR